MTMDAQPKFKPTSHDADRTLFVTVSFPACPYSEVEEGQACCRRHPTKHKSGKFHIFNFVVATGQGLAKDKKTGLLMLKCDQCGATDAEE
jgi:hypothetical protein